MAKRKAPAFQIYPDDWLADTQLMQATDATQGRWMRILCRMWRNPQKGRLDGPGSSLCKALGMFPDEFLDFLQEVAQFGFADLQINDVWVVEEGENTGWSIEEILSGNGKGNAKSNALVTPKVTLNNAEITLINRRMWREQKSKHNNAERQRRHKAKRLGNAEVTPPSSSPTPLPSKKVPLNSSLSTSPEERAQGGACEGKNAAPPSGPKQTPYPSKGRPSRQLFMACMQIFQSNRAQANEDSAWCAWCDMEDRGMLDEDKPYIRDRLIELFQEDDRWKEGYGPNFTNCIKNRAWRDTPFKRQNNGGQATGQPRANSEAQRVSQSHSNMAKALNRFKQGGQNADQPPGQHGQAGQGHHPVDAHGACLDLPGSETG